MGSQEMETQIILEVKVEKIAIEDDIQMCGNASGTRARSTYRRVEEQKSLPLVYAHMQLCIYVYNIYSRASFLSFLVGAFGRWRECSRPQCGSNISILHETSRPSHIPIRHGTLPLSRIPIRHGTHLPSHIPI